MKTYQSIGIMCAVAFFSSASLWAVPSGGQGGGDQGNDGGGNITEEITPTCTPITGGVNISWQIPGDTHHLYSYDIILVRHKRNTWIYTVAQGPGGNKALNHWSLEIINDAPPQCEGHISSTSPTASIGTDSSTGVKGVKWEMTGGPFILTMDDNYGTGVADVLVKSGKYFGVCQIKSPTCPMSCGRARNDRCGDRLDVLEESLQFGF